MVACQLLVQDKSCILQRAPTKLALNSLNKLQIAYNIELGYNIDEFKSFIPTNSWNGLYKGLLAGETLKLSLQQMHASYLENHKRLHTYVKTISLKNSKGIKTDDGEKDFNWNTDFVKKDSVFSLKELLVGGNKRIKSVSVTIPSVLSPYETFDAKLVETNSNESIIISKGINDFGVLPEEMHDGRYMPFEGLDPEECKWTLKDLKPDLKEKISDFIIEIKYTSK